MEKKKNNNNKMGGNRGQEAVDELLDIDIWAYNKKRENNDNNIATLNHLIESLTSDVQYDANFMKTFICTYQSFTTPTQLLSKLKQRFFYPSSIAPQRGSAIQMRVCVVLKHWVQVRLPPTTPLSFFIIVICYYYYYYCYCYYY